MEEIDEFLDLVGSANNTKFTFRGRFPGFPRLPDANVNDLFFDEENKRFIHIFGMTQYTSGDIVYHFRSFPERSVGEGYFKEDLKERFSSVQAVETPTNRGRR